MFEIYVMTVLTLVHKPNFRDLFARSDSHLVWLGTNISAGSWASSEHNEGEHKRKQEE